MDIDHVSSFVFLIFFIFLCFSIARNLFFLASVASRFLIEVLEINIFSSRLGWYPIQASFVLFPPFFLFFFIKKSLRFGMFFLVLFFIFHVSSFFFLLPFFSFRVLEI